MVRQQAEAFVRLVERDPGLRGRMENLTHTPEDAYNAVLDAGFDCTPEEIREALNELVGRQLSGHDLQAIAGGSSRGFLPTIPEADEAAATAAAV